MALTKAAGFGLQVFSIPTMVIGLGLMIHFNSEAFSILKFVFGALMTGFGFWMFRVGGKAAMLRPY